MADIICSMIVLAIFCLMVAHPGPVFAEQESEKVRAVEVEPKTDMDYEAAAGQAVR